MKITVFYCWVTRLTKVESHPTPGLSRYLCHKFSPCTPVENWTSEAAVDEVGGFICQCQRCKRCRLSLWERKIPGGGNGNLVQYSCLENPMNRGAWWVTVHGVAKSQTCLSAHTHTHTHTHTLLCQAKGNSVVSCPWKTVSPQLRGFGKFCSSVSREVAVDTIKVCARPGMPTWLLGPWNFPGKNPRVDCHFPLQGIFPTHGQTCVSCVSKQILYCWATTREAPLEG